MRVWMRHAIIIGGIVAPSIAVGFAAGWFLTKKALENDFQRRIDQEISATKAHYKALMASEFGMSADNHEAEAPSSIVTEAKKAFDAYRGKPEGSLKYLNINPKPPLDEIEIEREAETVVTNILQHDATREARPPADASRPHVISIDEFMQNEEELETKTLTYYAGDEVLTEEDEPIEVGTLTKLVGDLDLKDEFGHGSGDPNVVYIKAPELGSAYEIILSLGDYAKEVLGLD